MKRNKRNSIFAKGKVNTKKVARVVRELDAHIDADHFDGGAKMPMKDTIMGYTMNGKFYPMQQAVQAAQFDPDFYNKAIPMEYGAGPSQTITPSINIPEGPNFAMPIEPNLGGPSASPMPAPSEVKPVVITPRQDQLSMYSQFDITITKTITAGASIAGDLPFVLFSPVFLQSSYAKNNLLQNLPVGTTVTVTQVGTNSIAFTYTEGANINVLTITSTTTPYPSIVQALMTDRFDVIKTRETISDAITLSQINLPLVISTGSLFGGFTDNPISGVAQKSPDQFQNGIIDFNAAFTADKYRTVTGFMSQSAPTGFNTIFSFWANHVVRN